MFDYESNLISMQIMHYHYRLWRLAGLWPLPSDGCVYRAYSHLIQITCFIVFNALILLSLGQATDMTGIVDIFLPSTTTVIISIKAVFVIGKQTHIQRLFQLMHELESSIHQKSEKEILKRTKFATRILLIWMSIACYSAISLSFVVAVISPYRRLMWTAWFPFEWEHSDSSVPYWIAMSFQITCNAYIGILYSTCDVCGPTLYSILSAFLDVLGERLERIGWNDFETEETAEQELYDAVRYHNLCLQ